jgi:hypothetical protein
LPGTGKQKLAKPVSPKAFRREVLGQKTQALTETSPLQFEHTTGCLEGAPRPSRNQASFLFGPSAHRLCANRLLLRAPEIAQRPYGAASRQRLQELAPVGLVVALNRLRLLEGSER